MAEQNLGRASSGTALQPPHEVGGRASLRASASAIRGACPPFDPATAWWERSRAAVQLPC
eukprot:383135-Pleurochrysis_carterae.AAC.1